MYSWGFGGLLDGFGLLECLRMWFACMVGCLVYLVGFRLLRGCCLLVDIVEGCVALLLGFWWLDVLGWLF